MYIAYFKLFGWFGIWFALLPCINTVVFIMSNESTQWVIVELSASPNAVTLLVKVTCRTRFRVLRFRPGEQRRI